MRGRSFAARHALTGISATTIAPAPKLAWAWEGGEAFDSSPAIVDDVVYVGTATGELIAVGLTDGKLRWRYKAGEAIGESSPAVANGRVFIGDLDWRRARGQRRRRQADRGPSRRNPRSSRRRWSSATSLLMGSYDGKSLWPRRRHRQAAVGATRPRTTCTARRASSTASRTSPAATRCFTPCDVKTGKERFATSATAYTGASVALVNNVAYFGTFDNQVLALDLRSRKVLWRYEHPDRKFPFYSSAAVVDGTVVLGGRDRMVHALDAKTGKARWTHMTRARIDSSPAIAGGRVYVGSNDGRFYALDLASGKVVWQHDEGAALTASPALAVGES